ncbi:hypothetical protein [Crossiella cryophila]|uniref:Uncharacterized protein n=1 Tax=Crossiella cryophila TaxID=43355 RepID=A0A7W7CEE5_9PSEU|nr:hypothetical protein [Crossiella cryophila]MBB4679634.1 hypothetical protein [Crossiella cryophila]
MLSVRFNEVAAGVLDLRAAIPPTDLAPELRDLVTEGVLLRGGALVFARHADQADRTPGFAEDPICWECSMSSFHLDDVLPVHLGQLPGEPVISEPDQLLMLRHGLGFALEIARLVSALPAAVCCIVSANSTNGTFRFHQARQGESWLSPDLDAYRLEKLIVVEHGPASA